MDQMRSCTQKITPKKLPKAALVSVWPTSCEMMPSAVSGDAEAPTNRGDERKISGLTIVKLPSVNAPPKPKRKPWRATVPGHHAPSEVKLMPRNAKMLQKM